MTTVREATFEMLRARGMTTVFGNPGSTELPFLADFPDDFRYVLGLHEGVAVGMADGYAQASGRPALVNLHTAPGVGNAMGAIFNAQSNKSPLVITAGQQARSLMTLQALLTNRDAARMPHPLVKWSYEPPRAEDVPHALARATHLAALPPKGPVFVSIPMDDWRAEVDDDAVRHQTTRTVDGRAGADPALVRALAQRLAAAANPVFVAGAGRRRERRLGRRRRAGREGAAAGVGGARHRRRADRLPRGPPALPGRAAAGGRPGVGDARGPRPDPRRRLVGVRLLPEPPRAAAARGRGAGGDHERSRRGGAGADGGRDRRRRQAHARGAGGRARPLRARRAAAARARRAARGVRPDEPVGRDRRARRRLPGRRRGRARVARDHVRASARGCGSRARAPTTSPPAAASASRCPPSLGVQLAQPDRPVVCVLGEGSAQYAIQAFWTAVAYDIPVTFLVLRNEEYAILKWFGEIEQVTGAPGLDLPALDVAAVAEGYGVPSVRVDDRDGADRGAARRHRARTGRGSSRRAWRPAWRF